MADVLGKLDEISEMVEGAKAMPLSSSCVLNRPDLLAALDEVRDMLPHEIVTASRVVADRDGVVAQGRGEAERIIADAQAERARLVSATAVSEQAAREAERILAAARQEATGMRREADDYVDAKLAQFEIVLHKVSSAVERGREKLRGRHELAELAELADNPDDEPPLLP